jgi:uncharacterized membrane protein
MRENLWKTAKYLSILGIILALYLTYNFYAPVPSRACNINASFNCDAVIRGGELALFLGIPVSLIGLTGYIAILYSTIAKNKKLFLAMALFGTVFCLRMTFLEVFVIKVFCPVCIACQLVMLAELYISTILIRSSSKQS